MPESEVRITYCIYLTGEEILVWRDLLEGLLPPVSKEGDKMYKSTDMGYVSGRLPDKQLELVKKLWDQLNSNSNVV